MSAYTVTCKPAGSIVVPREEESEAMENKHTEPLVADVPVEEGEPDAAHDPKNGPVRSR